MHRLLICRETIETPAMATTVLLRWLLLCVLVCLAGAAGFYLLALLNEDVSEHRRAMNAAAYRAQLYFGQREALLNHLVDSVIETQAPAAAGHAAPCDDDGDVRRRTLGSDRRGRQLSLLLSARAERRLAEFDVQLIHVGADPGLPRRWLHGTPTPATPPPDELAPERLRMHAAGSPADTTVHWLASQRSASTIYLYRAAEADPDPTHWLVLALDPAKVASRLESEGAGDFAMFDRHGRPTLLRSRITAAEDWVALHAQRSDRFGYVWARGIPQGLALAKEMGEDGWQLVYHVPARLLLRDISAQIGISLMACLAAFAALRMLMRRIDRQLVQPALRRHQQLRESFEFGSTVIEMAPVGMCVLRCEDAKVMLENQLARDWLGNDTSAGDWTGPWRRATRPAGRLADNRRAVDFTTRDGRMLQTLYTATRYLDEDVLLCVFNDVSRHHQIQTALSAAKQAADEANQAKSAFVATMSHEIRTPLYGVLGTLELLGNTTLDTRQAQYLRTIQQSSSVLLRLISDVLDVSRIESGQLNLAAAAFSPLELAETTLRSYAAAAARKRLQILVSTDPRIPAQVVGDAGRIRQVLGNLLCNAIKFTDNGRIFLRVRQIAREGGIASISWQVTDTGIGIAASEHARLFEPFHQVSGQIRHDSTGLGLSISDHLVRLMNGEMRLTSEPGLGSSFTMVLPLSLVDDGEAADADGPRLLPHPPVYVRAPLPELADGTCQWLQRWGASARRYSADTPFSIAPDAILVDSDPRNAAAVDWPGPRVVALPDAGDHPGAHPDQPEWLTVTVFSIRAIAHAVAQLQHGQPPPPPAPIARLPQASLDLRVLVAEDNPINRQILREHLEALGCSVVTARNGHEALVCCRTEAFDVVLTDIHMPGLDGHELVRELRRQGFSMPVVGASANATQEERERCLAGGMNGYLVKPIDIGTLRHVLAGLATGAQT